MKQYRAGGLLEQVERQTILSAINAAEGNKLEACRVLGIDPATLYRKLKKWENQQKERNEINTGKNISNGKNGSKHQG